MTVPPPVIAANRVLLLNLIATNFFGQNTPAIAVTEAQYMEMWAQDAGGDVWLCRLFGGGHRSWPRSSHRRTPPLRMPRPTRPPRSPRRPLSRRATPRRPRRAPPRSWPRGGHSASGATSLGSGRGSRTRCRRRPALVGAVPGSFSPSPPRPTPTGSTQPSTPRSSNKSCGFLLRGGHGQLRLLDPAADDVRPRYHRRCPWCVVSHSAVRRPGLPSAARTAAASRPPHLAVGHQGRRIVGALQLGRRRTPKRPSKNKPCKATTVNYAAAAGPTNNGILQGMPMTGGGTTRRHGFTHKYGFKRNVLVRPPSAG